MKKFRVRLVKRRLKAAYQSYIQALDSSSAGRDMTELLPSVLALRERCNPLLARLAQLDPENVPCTSFG